MRGALEGLETPHPLGHQLPALYQEDDFAQRFTAALDEVLAPVLWTLDNRAAYFDPRFAPADFVCWLAEWVGVVLDETWSVGRKREMVSRAGQLHARRGTRQGLSEQIQLVTGVVPDIEDTGGTSWSATPGAPLPGRPGAQVTVRIRVPDPNEIDRRRVDALVREVKPAHVRHRIELVPEG